MLTRADLPRGFGSQLLPYLAGGPQSFLNDRVVNSYLSRRAGPRIVRRIPKAVAK